MHPDPHAPPSPAGDLAQRVYQASHLTGTFVLRSGATSSEYFDKYRFESDPRLLRELAEAMAGLLPEGADGLAGLELGGVPLATVLSQVTGLPAGFVRKQAKPYGTRRLRTWSPPAAPWSTPAGPCAPRAPRSPSPSA
jgi:orotate phosphoribosyltransferase